MLRFPIYAFLGALALSVASLTHAGKGLPAGGQAISSSTNAGAHGSAAGLSQKEKGLVEYTDPAGRSKIYAECLSGDGCGVPIVNSSNQFGGVTLRVVDAKLGFLDVLTDSQGFIVQIRRVSA